MMTKRMNPFKPTAGRMPPLLVGRDPVISDFIEGLDNGPGAPGRLMRVTGARGVGKTVILTEFGRIAKQRKWDVIDETASQGLTQRLISRITPTHTPFSSNLKPSIEIAGVGINLGGATVSNEVLPMTLRDALSTRLDSLEKKKAGLLITIDEVQAAERNDIVAIATAVQHMIRDERDIAFVFAGLPAITSKWLNDEVLTFLRRSQAEPLGDVALSDVGDAFQTTFNESGLTIDGDALRMAVDATEGYPFMIQLVGYHIWRIADHNGKSSIVTVDMARQGIADAMARLGDTVHGPEMDGLSAIDKTYLLAMAQDDGPSSTAVIAQRMGRDPQYANVYRNRLLEAQVIKEVGRGKVDFDIPYLREYLRQHAAYIRMSVEQ